MFTSSRPLRGRERSGSSSLAPTGRGDYYDNLIFLPAKLFPNIPLVPRRIWPGRTVFLLPETTHFDKFRLFLQQVGPGGKGCSGYRRPKGSTACSGPSTT